MTVTDARVVVYLTSITIRVAQIAKASPSNPQLISFGAAKHIFLCAICYFSLTYQGTQLSSNNTEVSRQLAEKLRKRSSGKVACFFFLNSQGAYEGTQCHARARARTGDLEVSEALMNPRPRPKCHLWGTVSRLLSCPWSTRLICTCQLLVLYLTLPLSGMWILPWSHRKETPEYGYTEQQTCLPAIWDTRPKVMLQCNSYKKTVYLNPLPLSNICSKFPIVLGFLIKYMLARVHLFTSCLLND